MIRRGFQVAAGLGSHRALPRAPLLLPRFNPASAFGSSTDFLVSRFCRPKADLKDYALPNASWCPEMLSLYHEFLEKTKTDDWVKVPSFKSNRHHIRGFKLPLGLEVTSGKDRWGGSSPGLVPCPHPRFAHGGSLATMTDEAFAKTAFLAGGGLFTLNFSIKYKNPVPVGSLAVLNINVEKTEDQKIYLSCIIQSRDQQTVYAKASGVFLQKQLEEESPQ
ncbi:acyl-coenzyme A thioesterase THEM5 isoform X2 [Vicugna pacos]|uniref:Acyl-coenzyme A thioesterase THEM5 isoform X2 n=1 Tax=Vicugna pacos TaxID=30538 RepID=A0ABM5C1Y0_VICPA